MLEPFCLPWSCNAAGQIEVGGEGKGRLAVAPHTLHPSEFCNSLSCLLLLQGKLSEKGLRDCFLNGNRKDGGRHQQSWTALVRVLPSWSSENLYGPSPTVRFHLGHASNCTLIMQALALKLAHADRCKRRGVHPYACHALSSAV